jgi:dihydroorotase
MNTEIMRRAFDYAASKDLLISQHCEDHNLTENFAMNESALSYKLGLKGYPNVAEEVIVERDTRLSEYCGNRRYHVQHISAAGSVSIVRKAKAKGLRVTCEVTPHHFALDESVLVNYDTNHKMNPPLRGTIDIEACLEGLKDGTIDCIASDHAPHASHEKDVEYENAPSGISGLETSLGLSLTYLVHKDVITIEKLIEKMSINPRRIIKQPDVKIEEGELANITIFDPEEEWVVNKNDFKSRGKNTPFDGLPLKGKAKYAINNNKIYKSIL